MIPRDLQGRIAVRLDPVYARGWLTPPYRPAQRYPELGPVVVSSTPNGTYDAVRDLLRLWHVGGLCPTKPNFSPLSVHVEPGMRVAIKPNFVLHTHPSGDAAMYGTVTDGAVLRVVLDYVALALRGSGTITIAESPIRMTDFDTIVRWTGLDRVLDDVVSTWGVNVELVDVRDQTVADPRTFHSSLRVRHQRGDPRGGVQVDLATHSAFEAVDDSMHRLRSTAAVGRNEVRDQHKLGRHVYEFSRSILDADAIISVPKIKTHKKAGITGALKIFVGAVVRKEWLPHHRRGAPSVGGDEFADDIDPNLKLREWAKDLHMQSRFGRWIVNPGVWLYQHTIKGTLLDVACVRQQSPMVNGGWSGNDTCWRMVHDLYRAVLYAGADGALGSDRRRLPLTIMDGLVAGEGDGPLSPDPRNAGILMMGFDAPWLDHFAALLMGYDPAKIPQISRALAPTAPLPLTTLRKEDIELCCEPADLADCLARGLPASDPFVPPAGWARHLVSEEMFQFAVKRQSKGSLDY
jgi:uncharacterized protein (DUF362 family)